MISARPTPLVSIVMPCFNAANHILSSVDSVFAQTWSNLELIVVDDGSRDHTLEVLASLRDTRLRVIPQFNSGAGAARNRGIIEAKGEFIAFLDADDTWQPAFLDKMLDTLQQEHDATLAYCGWQNIDPDGPSGIPYVPPDYEAEGKVEQILTACPWPIHAALTRASAIRDCGAFDPSLTSCMDYDLWLRIASRYRIVRVPEVLAYYIHHGGSRITRNRARIAINNWRVQRRFVRGNPQFFRSVSRRRVRELVEGRLLQYGYECYWQRDLDAARAIFRKTMATGYGSLNDWKYMLPALLPRVLHQRLVTWFGTDN